LIQDLAAILGVAAIVTFIFKRIRQPVVLGYIVAGIIVGPYTPGILSVTDTESIKVWADLGVIFLMFTLGLEFSFRRLARVGMSAAITAVLQIAAMVGAGLLLAHALGWSRMDAVFLGCMIAISSTTIIIKTFEELGFKTKMFAELVFGILIVEDLAAILMLVALTNIAMTSRVGGVELLFAGGKLLLIVGGWFLVGMFMVPRSVRLVSRHGNDELLTVMAIALCLALVALAAHFHYSVALGAFVMGSILAESSEAKRIEHLVQPLKDIFGAIFFVSVGMLLNPHAILENYGAILLIVAVIIVGKFLSVSLGAFITGQTVRNSIQTGSSMAQIGEFSFIIASLGLSYGVIASRLYPIIVAASLVTTFTTPYLVKSSGRFARFIERGIPSRLRAKLDSYVTLVQRLSISSENRKNMVQSSIKWALNAVVVISLFTLAADKLVPFAEHYLEHRFSGLIAAWLLVFALASPSIWAMLFSFRSQTHPRSFLQDTVRLASQVLAVGLIGLLSMGFFPAKITLVATALACSLFLIAFRHKAESYYLWFEQQFHSSFQAEESGATKRGKNLNRLAPWDAHLVEFAVPARSFLVGKTLLGLKLREHYGLNVVVIIRHDENIVAPMATELVYPGDRLLCFATDSEIERFKADIASEGNEKDYPRDLEGFDIRCLKIDKDSPLEGITIRQSGIREKFGCIVVGLEREGERIRSPSSDLNFAEGDILWIVGERSNLLRLEPEFGTNKDGISKNSLF
jgi:CPA2 family monovalent cation:H+ antiporter-2